MRLSNSMKKIVALIFIFSLILMIVFSCIASIYGENETEVGNGKITYNYISYPEDGDDYGFGKCEIINGTSSYITIYYDVAYSCAEEIKHEKSFATTDANYHLYHVLSCDFNRCSNKHKFISINYTTDKDESINGVYNTEIELFQDKEIKSSREIMSITMSVIFGLISLGAIIIFILAYYNRIVEVIMKMLSSKRIK